MKRRLNIKRRLHKRRVYRSYNLSDLKTLLTSYSHLEDLLQPFRDDNKLFDSIINHLNSISKSNRMRNNIKNRTKIAKMARDIWKKRSSSVQNSNVKNISQIDESKLDLASDGDISFESNLNINTDTNVISRFNETKSELMPIFYSESDISKDILLLDSEIENNSILKTSIQTENSGRYTEILKELISDLPSDADFNLNINVNETISDVQIKKSILESSIHTDVSESYSKLEQELMSVLLYDTHNGFDNNVSETISQLEHNILSDSIFDQQSQSNLVVESETNNIEMIPFQLITSGIGNVEVGCTDGNSALPSNVTADALSDMNIPIVDSNDTTSIAKCPSEDNIVLSESKMKDSSNEQSNEESVTVSEINTKNILTRSKPILDEYIDVLKNILKTEFEENRNKFTEEFKNTSLINSFKEVVAREVNTDLILTVQTALKPLNEIIVEELSKLKNLINYNFTAKNSFSEPKKNNVDECCDEIYNKEV